MQNDISTNSNYQQQTGEEKIKNLDLLYSPSPSTSDKLILEDVQENGSFIKDNVSRNCLVGFLYLRKQLHASNYVTAMICCKMLF